MNLRKLIFTNNACYKAGRTITVKGIMVHSTGANNPNLRVMWVRTMDCLARTNITTTGIKTNRVVGRSAYTASSENWLMGVSLPIRHCRGITAVGMGPPAQKDRSMIPISVLRNLRGWPDRQSLFQRSLQRSHRTVCLSLQRV